MIQINLLPKEYRRRVRPFQFDKKWIYATAAVGLVFALLFSLTIYKKHKISTLNNKIASVQRQRTALEKDIKLIDGLTELKQKLMTRMSAIESLDMNRGMWVSILEDFSTHIPELLWLTGVSEEQPKVEKTKSKKPTKANTNKGAEAEADSAAVVPTKKITNIDGYAYTLNSVASFMVGLMKSNYFKDIELAYAKQESMENIAAYNFRITCVIDYEVWLNETYQPESGMPSPLAEY